MEILFALLCQKGKNDYTIVSDVSLRECECMNICVGCTGNSMKG